MRINTICIRLVVSIASLAAIVGCVAEHRDGRPDDVVIYDNDHHFEHHGFYDDHHAWHGGYYDEHHEFHDDPHDFDPNRR